MFDLIAPSRSKFFIWGVFLCFLVIWFYTLGARTLVPTDEGRYAEMAREMAVTGDWITLRLNGIKYFEKPPLQTWMNALTFQLFGLGEWQARLWTGLCGLFGIVAVAFTGRRIFSPRVGFYAPLILASSFFWAGLGHINTLDMGLSAMMTLSLCALLLAQQPYIKRTEPGLLKPLTSLAAQRGWMLLCWAGMALAVLSKGLIGLILPGAVLVLYTLVRRDRLLWKRLHFLGGSLVFLLITLPWFILVSLKNPEFLHFFFIHEHFQRYTTLTHHRAGPFYYFMPIVFFGILPWLGVLCQSIWIAKPDRVQMRQNSGQFQPILLLFLWITFIFLFFSFSGSKLPSYILPIFPALALLVARYMDQCEHSIIRAAYSLLAFSVIGMVICWFAPSFAPDAFSQPLMAAHVPWIFVGCMVAAVGAGLALRWKARKDEAMIALGACGFIASQIFMVGHDPQGRYAAGIEMVPVIQSELTPQTDVFIVGTYEQALPFYLRRTLTMVGHADELAFGLAQEPHLWLPTVEAFVMRWQADTEQGKKCLAIVHPEVYQYLKAQQLPMQVIAQDPRRVVVTNRVSNTPLPS